MSNLASLMNDLNSFNADLHITISILKAHVTSVTERLEEMLGADQYPEPDDLAQIVRDLKQLSHLVGVAPPITGEPERDPERIDKILGLIREVWTKNPELRLLQLLLGACTLHRGNVFYVEDSILAATLKQFYGVADSGGEAAL